MRRSSLLFGVFLLGLVLVLPAITVHADAQSWVGNYNGEFGTKGVTPSQVYVEDTFSQQMSYNSPNGYMSLQYNPDNTASYFYNGGQGFQSGIISDESGCIVFTIQVYDLNTGYPVWSDYYPNSGCASAGSGAFASGAQWYISEDVNSKIYEVDFYVTGSNYISYSLYPPQSWLWLRSNICGVERTLNRQLSALLEEPRNTSPV